MQTACYVCMLHYHHISSMFFHQIEVLTLPLAIRSKIVLVKIFDLDSHAFKFCGGLFFFFKNERFILSFQLKHLLGSIINLNPIHSEDLRNALNINNSSGSSATRVFTATNAPSRWQYLDFFTPSANGHFYIHHD